MQRLNLRMISHYSNPQFDYIIKNIESNLTLKNIYLDFMKKGINIEMIKQIKFIKNGKHINNLDEILYDSDSNNLVYLFTNDQLIKSSLISFIFTSVPKDENKSNSIQISTKLNVESTEDNQEELYEPTEEEVNSINEKIVENFKDKEFRDLLQICIKKPELIKMVNSYLSNGNIIEKIDFDSIILEEFKYQNEFEFIKSFYQDNFMTTLSNELYVKKILNHFKGHLNLSLRYLIYNTKKNEE